MTAIGKTKWGFDDGGDRGEILNMGGVRWKVKIPFTFILKVGEDHFKCKNILHMFLENVRSKFEM